MQFLEKLGGVLGGWFRANKNKEAIKKADQERQQLLNSLDWQPTLASENAPTFKKAESPIARSFLESLMTGDNPMMVSPGEVNSAAKAGAAQRRTDQRWGTTDERVGRQREIMNETPWEVNTTPKSVNDSGYVRDMVARYPALQTVPNVGASEIEEAMRSVGSSDGAAIASYIRQRRGRPLANITAARSK